MNVELLQRVKAVILEEPRRVDMDTWAVDWDQVPKNERPTLLPPCHTTACIAGWAVILGEYHGNLHKLFADHLTRSPWLSSEGRAVLELDEGEAVRLFYVGNWPTRFRRRYELATDPQAKAQVVAERIDFFIATEGTDEEQNRDL